MTGIPSEEMSRTPLRSISALIQNEQSSGASGASSVATPTNEFDTFILLAKREFSAALESTTAHGSKSHRYNPLVSP
jgi:hypothetical protein